MSYKKYKKGEKVIMATERAFKVVYEGQGYEEFVEEVPEESTEEVPEESGEETGEPEEITEEEIKEGMNELTVAELTEMAKKEDIKGYSSMKKAELIEALM